MDVLSFEALIADCEDIIRDIDYQIVSAPPHSDTGNLRRVVEAERKTLARLRMMRVAYAPDPNKPLP